VDLWFIRTGFGWTLNMVSLSACALGRPYHYRAAEEQQQQSLVGAAPEWRRRREDRGLLVLARWRHEERTGKARQGSAGKLALK